ncbi:hypothetical protein LG314_11775 [Agrococcus terreus]|uniref:hypothetical protein n=1 Tax=Agrococcus terreus TaxID=574649 RepID=UPI0038509361
MSLHAELVRGVDDWPDFALLLPAGWRSVDADEASIEGVLERATAQLKRSGRPDLDAELRTTMRQALRGGAGREVVRLFLQATDDPEAMTPMSMVAARLRPPSGASLDTYVRELVQERGAAPLAERSPVLAWTQETTTRIDGAQVRTLTRNGLIAVPGTERRQGLLLSAVIVRGAAGAELPQATADAMVAMADAVFSTFRWTA